MFYKSAPCNGVKVCPEKGCHHVASVRELRRCKDHPTKPLRKTNDTERCPVQFGYVYPVDHQGDHRRWILGFVRQAKGPLTNLHNHPVHSPSHPLSKTVEDISNAAKANVTLKPSDISRGKGLGYIPAAVDKACASMDKISRVMKTSRNNSLSCSPSWDVTSFEAVADDIDARDEEHRSSYSQGTSLSLRKLSRPYLVSAGIDNGIHYIFTMNPLMAEVLSKAEFIEADITFNETKEYPYLFNVVAFNELTMEWMVVSRVRMNQQDHKAYRLGFLKTFQHCSLAHPSFKPGESLLGVVVDWSDSEVRGLSEAVGESIAKSLLKGCRVHWNRSWQRIRDRVASSTDKAFEKMIFTKIASQIPKLPIGEHVCDCFKVLCKQLSAQKIAGVITSLTQKDVDFVDRSCDWSIAKNWAEWWMRPSHLQMLHPHYSAMDPDTWDRCPSTTNAVER